MNTSNSSIYGKAYEYACILALIDIVSNNRHIEVEENDSVAIARSRYESLEDAIKEEMLLSSTAGINAIIEMEPRITEDGCDKLTITLQPDTAATRNGDIRDVLIVRRSIAWEIGISVKHNHSALKHSRISPHIDFGKEWMDVPCSPQYFVDINKVFDMLAIAKGKGLKWSELSSKEDDVYVPLLTAFMNEFNSLQTKQNVTAKLVEYLIGSNGRDYYKLIHHDNHTTTIMPFNIFGTLNMATNKQSPTL